VCLGGASGRRDWERGATPRRRGSRACRPTSKPDDPGYAAARDAIKKQVERLIDQLQQR
jgi:hypothetical protein